MGRKPDDHVTSVLRRMCCRPTAPFPTKTFMIMNPTATGPVSDRLASDETKRQWFEQVLSKNQFKPLKAILDSLCREDLAVRDAVNTANSYPELLTMLGYRVVLARQIHVQDCYSRLGMAGGIKAVLSHHDMATYSTLVTLVNFDSTLTTTPNCVGFFSARLAELKTLLMN